MNAHYHQSPHTKAKKEIVKATKGIKRCITFRETKEVADFSLDIA